MMRNGVTSIPPKVAGQLADRAKNLDGCFHIGEGVYKFAVGNIVVVLMSMEPPFGHQYRDPKEAEDIRQKIYERNAITDQRGQE